MCIMKCSKCQTEMFQAKESWLCMECGHLEPISADTVPLTIIEKKIVKLATPIISPPQIPEITKVFYIPAASKLAKTKTLIEQQQPSSVVHTINHKLQNTSVESKSVSLGEENSLPSGDNSTILIEKHVKEASSVATFEEPANKDDKPKNIRFSAPSAADLHPQLSKTLMQDITPAAKPNNLRQVSKVTEVDKAGPPSIDPLDYTPQISDLTSAQIISEPTTSPSQTADLTTVKTNSSPIAVAQDIPAIKPVLSKIAPVTHPRPMNTAIIVSIAAVFLGLIAAVGIIYAYFQGLDIITVFLQK